MICQPKVAVHSHEPQSESFVLAVQRSVLCMASLTVIICHLVIYLHFLQLNLVLL